MQLCSCPHPLAHLFMLLRPCCRMSRSFGAYNKKGYCGSGSCHQFAIVIGEFNLNLGEAVSPASVAIHFGCHSWQLPCGGTATLCTEPVVARLLALGPGTSHSMQ